MSALRARILPGEGGANSLRTAFPPRERRPRKRFSARLALALCALVACASRPPPAPAVLPLPSLGPAPAHEAQALAPKLVAFPSGALTLHGFLWRPTSSGRHPAIVFNHGSEHFPGDAAGQAEFFVPHGFVLFVPHRRGHGRSADAGPYIGAMRGAASWVRELEAQVDDVSAAVAYVASLPFVDARHIAVSGCSFGGIEALFAAARTPGIIAAIDFAGGAMSWARAPLLQARMLEAARQARVPVFFIQAANDWDTQPSEVLSGAMRDAGKPVRVRVFPPNGTTHEDGHHFCVGGRAPAWGDDVLAFLGSAPR